MPSTLTKALTAEIEFVRTDNLHKLPDDLPAPVDDGAADHLIDTPLPDIALISTSGELVNLNHAKGLNIVFCYPRTGRPNEEALGGTENWNAIPGARGCTPQACAYRDGFADLKKLGLNIFGLSTQDTEYQKEAALRLNLPYQLLSDNDLLFLNALNLPFFKIANEVLIKRITLIIRDGVIIHYFYPVFPPDSDIDKVLAWINANGL